MTLHAAAAHFLETCQCVCVCVCVLEHLMQGSREREKEIADKGINRNTEASAMCTHWSSQPLANKPFLCGVRPVLPAATQTYTRITDVTRIQEGVAAYYILTAHTRCLAWLGLFKRLRLDKQRGFRLCSLLISSPSACICHISPVLLLLQTSNMPHTQKRKRKQNPHKRP